jgi:hypothetical protein
MAGKEKTVAVVVKSQEQAPEALRSTAGLLLANHTASLFVLDLEVEPTEKFKEDLDFLLEMEGLAFTNREANALSLPFTLLDDREVVAKLRENQMIIPF